MHKNFSDHADQARPASQGVNFLVLSCRIGLLCGIDTPSCSQGVGSGTRADNS